MSQAQEFLRVYANTMSLSEAPIPVDHTTSVAPLQRRIESTIIRRVPVSQELRLFRRDMLVSNQVVRADRHESDVVNPASEISVFHEIEARMPLMEAMVGDCLLYTSDAADE